MNILYIVKYIRVLIQSACRLMGCGPTKSRDVEPRPNPLHVAVFCGDVARCQQLLEEGAAIQAKGMRGQTALHEAVCAVQNKTKLCEILLNRGADLAARNDRGETALHVAADSFTINVKTCALLLDRGADLFAKDNSGKT